MPTPCLPESRPAPQRTCRKRTPDATKRSASLRDRPSGTKRGSGRDPRRYAAPLRHPRVSPQQDSYKFAGIGPGGMGRPAIKGAGVDDIHGGLFGRFVDGYVAHIIAVGGKQGERTVARLKLEGRSQPRIDRRMIRLASTRTGTGCNTFIGALSLRLMYQNNRVSIIAARLKTSEKGLFPPLPCGFPACRQPENRD